MPQPDGSTVDSWSPGRESTFADRWPAVLPPELQERCYYGKRRESLRWVGDLRTASGKPRAERVARCGDPVAALRVGDWVASWAHRWCRDRACYACQRSRSRRLAHELRETFGERRERPLYFVTLTRPRMDGEGARRAWTELQAAWEALRHHKDFAGIAGGVRVVEAVWSDGKRSGAAPGWHVHCHLAVELRDDAVHVPCPTCQGEGEQRFVDSIGRRQRRRCRTCGTRRLAPARSLPESLALVVRRWCALVGGSTASQCAVPLDVHNCGQLAKYLSKAWELPTSQARELFEAAAGRRCINGFGAWRSWRRFAGDVEQLASRWLQGAPIRAVERMHPDARVVFGYAAPARLEGPRGESWRPWLDVVSVRAADLLAALRADARPVWQRAERVDASSLTAVAVAECSQRWPAPRAGPAPPEQVNPRSLRVSTRYGDFRRRTAYTSVPWESYSPSPPLPPLQLVLPRLP